VGAGQAARLCVRGVVQDRERVRWIATALATEGFTVSQTLKPVAGRIQELPVIFVCSEANSRRLDFANEVRLHAERRLAVIVAYEDLSNSFLRNIVEHAETVSLVEWNGKDRSCAEFRDLVLACRRISIGYAGSQPLPIANLIRRRAQAAAQTTVAASEWPLLNKNSTNRQADADAHSQPLHRSSQFRKAFPLLRVSPEDAPAHAKNRRGDYRRSETLDHEAWLRQIVSIERGQSDFLMSDSAASHPDTSKPQADTTPQSELLDASVFAPKAAVPGDQILVQVFLHRLSADEAVRAQAMARGADGSADRRSVGTLDAPVTRGQRIDVTLAAPGLIVDHATQYLTWRGSPRACQFLVSVPRRRVRKTYYLEAFVSIDGVPIGVLGFMLKIARVQKAMPVEIRGERCRRHDYAFISYASPDRGEVYRCVQGLNAFGIKYFQDRLSLEPGTHWKPRLRQEIDRCDVFLLFWSEHAAKSKWVLWETKYALRRQKTTSKHLPYIRPMPLARLSRAPVPKWLSHIHFHDPLRDHMVADQAERIRDQTRARRRGHRAS
jgi:hypothetical protein